MRRGGHQKRELTEAQDIAAAPRPPLQETLVLGHSQAWWVSSSKRSLKQPNIQSIRARKLQSGRNIIHLGFMPSSSSLSNIKIF